MPEMSAGAHALHQVMMDSANSMVAHPEPKAMTTDKAFALLMAEHHASAVKMADIEMKEGKVAKLRTMARKMKQAQLKEIHQLNDIAESLK